MHWLRLWTDMLDSAKVQGLPPETFRTWINLLCAAKRHDCGGVLPPLRQLAFWLRMPEFDLSVHLEHMVAEGLIDATEDGYQTHDWEHWQPPSDSSTERSRKSRAASKSTRETHATDATLQQRCSNVEATSLQRPRAEQSRDRAESETRTQHATLHDAAELKSLADYVDQITGGSWGRHAYQRVRSNIHTVATWRAGWAVVAAMDRLPNKPWPYVAKIISECPGGIPPEVPLAKPRLVKPELPPSPYMTRKLA